MQTTIFFAVWGMVLTATAVAQETTPAAEVDGAALYDEHCKTCHGPGGGAPPPAMLRRMENLTSVTVPAFLAETPDDSLVGVIQTGRGDMKPLADELSLDQVLAIVRYMRTFQAAAPAAPAAAPEAPEADEEPAEAPGS
jgi:mono/diheme cytochrome c family protein